MLGAVLPHPLLSHRLALHLLRPHRLVALEDGRITTLRVRVDHLHVAAQPNTARGGKGPEITRQARRVR